MLRMSSFNLHSIRDRHFYDIGEVILLLRILVFKFWEPVMEELIGYHHDPCINFANLELRFASILLFNNSNNPITFTVANNSAVTGGVV